LSSVFRYTFSADYYLYPARFFVSLVLVFVTGNSGEKADKIYYETLRVGVKRGCFEYGVVE